MGQARFDGIEAAEVSVSYRGLVALDEVALALGPGEILGLIGPNGAGKATLVNVISGFAAADSGDVTIAGVSCARAAPADRVRLGLARTFQGGRLFGRLSARENLEAAALGVTRSARRARERVDGALRRMHLAHLAEKPAASLPHGEERRLSLARALVTEPRFLLLDEPAAGLDDAETAELSRTIAGVRDDLGCGLLVIEHDMRLIMGLCDRIQVLSGGRTLRVGEPREIAADPAVQEAYLGANGNGDAHG
jgi:ABC-type branched-subunit amino acid transport system ATPase component